MRAAALAVDDAHAAEAPLPAVAQKLGDADGRHVPVHAVQIELVFNHPVAAPQLPQHVATQACAEIGELIAGVERVVQAQRSKRLREDGALVAQALLWNRETAAAVSFGAAAGC